MFGFGVTVRECRDYNLAIFCYRQPATYTRRIQKYIQGIQYQLLYIKQSDVSKVYICTIVNQKQNETRIGQLNL